MAATLQDVQRLYPPERVERSRARLSNVWRGTGYLDRIPLIYTGLPVRAELAAQPDTSPASTSDAFGDVSDAQALADQLEAICDRAPLDDDYLPSLFPGCRQALIPSAFGAHEVRSGGHDWSTPILRDAQDALALGQADFGKGLAAQMLERVRYFRASTHGQLPIQLPDMQGPLDLANNLWGTESLLIAMHEEPAAVHHLLDCVTEAFIAYIWLLLEAADGDLVPIHCMPSVWMPADLGVALSEDLLAIVSPRLYALFGRPYNERISRAFRGVVIHSCGSVEHNLRTLAGTDGLRGINLSASETDLAAVLSVVADRQVILSHHAAATCGTLPRLSPEEHVRLCVRLFGAQPSRGIILVTPVDMERDEALALSPIAARLAQISR